jgi:predicted amidohydrolase
MRDLIVALVQAATVWRDAAANRALYGELVRPLAARADLIVLPETFLSGFSNEASAEAESMEGESLAWMRGLAAEVDAVVTGSLLVREGDGVYNRLVWMRPDGSHERYDKRHLFRMAREHERFAAGDERLVVELHGWRICPLVCYDLRFPVWSRNRFDAAARRLEYDLLIYVANWPNARRHAWGTLLRARAIENLSYCIGVNRVGTDGNDLLYPGCSAVLNFLGETEIELGSQPQVACVRLSAERLAEHRARFPAWLDADGFSLD